MQIKKSMQESELVYEFVANRALKGFVLQDGRVMPKLELTIDDNEAIGTALTKICGHDINKWLQHLDLNKLIRKTIAQIEIADILPGSIIVLELSHKETLEVIYQGNFEFCVYKDSVGILRPLDVLKALTLSFGKGEVIFFKVYRDGTPYPNSDKLFRGKVCRITILNTVIEGCQIPQNKNFEATTSLEKVFAWKAANHPARFTEENLTESSHAVFILDLMKNEFSINPNFSKSYYEDLLDALGPACKITRTGKGAQTISPGKFSLALGSKSYSFYIKKKAEVGL